VDAGRSYEIELITPMFGGGVETRVNDPSFPIRPTAIRGQLQFWWRATVGAQYATRQELRAAQSAIWGDTTQASRVQVRVELLGKAIDPKVCAVIKPNHKGKDQVYWEPPFQNTALPYALFPFQGKPANKEGPKVDPASCTHNARFHLTVVCHKDIDFAKHVEPAIWAWVNFGGLGSRTRRGCGAIKGREVEFNSKGKRGTILKELLPKDARDLAGMWQHYMPELFPLRDWPTMAERVSVRTVEQPADAIPVWDWLIGRFRHFRQGEGLARNPRQQGSNRPGRSRFSEPETIRRVTASHFTPHARLPQIPDDAFPRAELGLPIVFQFKDQGEPPDTVLYPGNDSEGKQRERMASPLILKPLALQGGKAIPLIPLTPQWPGSPPKRGCKGNGIMSGLRSSGRLAAKFPG
jgi:CRISPR-associated protein Cmr1